jgi:hypothetical protein
MDHDLLAYLLQGLDPDEERAVEAHLEEDPAARKELQKWRRLLDPLNHVPPVEPPATLYMNTLRAVAGQMVQTRGPVFPARDESGDGGGRWWRRADVLVAAAAILVLALLLPPVLVYVRARQEIMACQQNLERLHRSYKQYWEQNNNVLPNLGDLEEPRIRFAGMHPVLLREKKCWNDEINLVCPGVGKGDIRPLRDRSEAMELLSQGEPNWPAQVGGQYAYPLGFFQEDRLCALTRDLGDETPYLSDRSPIHAGKSNSPNHGGKGQNVLFMGGHVRWMTARIVGDDDIFLNADGKLEASRSVKDIVLGGSEVRPEPLKYKD